MIAVFFSFYQLLGCSKANFEALIRRQQPHSTLFVNNYACLIRHKGHWEPCNNTGYQSQTKCISGILTRNFLIKGDWAIPLCYSTLVGYLQNAHFSKSIYKTSIWAKVFFTKQAFAQENYKTSILARLFTNKHLSKGIFYKTSI